MTMTPALRKLALTAHVVSSVGWLGAAAAYLALAVAALSSAEPQLVRAAYLAMEPIAWAALIPLALASLLTGVVQALGTKWGLLRHWWVVMKLALTVFATFILLLHTPTTVEPLARLAEANRADPGALPGEVLHAGGGLLVLLAAAVLAVYKPPGMTQYGRRKLERRVVPAP
jgi:hypothetical protein